MRLVMIRRGLIGMDSSSSLSFASNSSLLAVKAVKKNDSAKENRPTIAK